MGVVGAVQRPDMHLLFGYPQQSVSARHCAPVAMQTGGDDRACSRRIDGVTGVIAARQLLDRSVVGPVGALLLGQQSNEFFPSVMKPRLYRVDWHIQNVRNFVASVSLHVPYEHGSTLLRHARKNLVRPLQFLTHFHRGECARALVEKIVENVFAARGQRLKPEVAPMLAQLTAGDPIKPSRHVVAIEGLEPAPGHEKNLLREVLGVGVGRPERPQPSYDLSEPCPIDGRQVRTGFAFGEGSDVHAR